MCGISCILALDERRRPAGSNDAKHVNEKLRKSLEIIRHRGPDSCGSWISEDGRVALGHTRLDINDLTPTGSQPLHSTNGTVHAVVNGEIYDFERLRVEMKEKTGYQFQSTSDSELALALYEYYGLSFLSEIRGEFSICLYDSKRELFIAVRDRYGIKPLFWTIQNGELMVAAEMKAFLPLGWQPEWDVQAIVEGDTQISNCTPFRNVQKVRPGHMLVCRHFGVVNEQQYWESEYPDKNIKETRTEQEMIQGVRDRLIESIKLRLRADVKVGVSLSGGIDSSTVAGIVNQLLREGHSIGSEAENERLSCFGIAFDADSGMDESDIANRTADFLNVKFYKKHMDEKALAESFEDATWMCEQPNYDLNFIGTYALSELFREKGFKVNINGQGSDEILGGYNIFLPDMIREPDTTFPGNNIDDATRASELAKYEAFQQELWSNRLTPKDDTVARRQFNNLLTPQIMTVTIGARLPIHPDFINRTPPNMELTYAESLPVSILEKIRHKWHPLHSAECIFVRGHLQNVILSHLGDRGEMAHSIEGRTPFLDHHLTEYVNGLPPSMKIRWDPNLKDWTEKYVLREAAKPFITDELYKRRKHGYAAPTIYPVGGPIYQLFKRLVTVENLGRLGWIDTTGLDTLVDEAFENKDSQKIKLASLLAQLVLLHDRFGVLKAVPRDAVTQGARKVQVTNGVLN